MTDMQAAGMPAPVRALPERHYNLFLREGTSRFYWKLGNEGITFLGIGNLIVLGTWRLWDVNRPRRYSPEQLPSDLLS